MENKIKIPLKIMKRTITEITLNTLVISVFILGKFCIYASASNFANVNNNGNSNYNNASNSNGVRPISCVRTMCRLRADTHLTGKESLSIRKVNKSQQIK